MAFSPMIVLIDVSHSHTFLSSSSTFFLFRLLGVNFLAHAHPLHECSNYRKGVDQFAVRDSNVSRWCLRASKGLGRKRKKVVENNYLLKFHTWSPLDSYLDSSPDH